MKDKAFPAEVRVVATKMSYESKRRSVDVSFVDWEREGKGVGRGFRVVGMDWDLERDELVVLRLEAPRERSRKR